MKILIPALLAIVLGASAANAAVTAYAVDTAKSRIAFSGVHAGNPFTGQFHEWNAEIAFSETALKASRVTLRITTQSAATGNKMYDGTLPSQDWLNSAQYPVATFESKGFAKQADGSYVMQGNLSLRGVTKSLAVPFTLGNVGGAVEAKAHFTLDRLDYGIGSASDAKAEWVDRAITVDADILATPQPALHP